MFLLGDIGGTHTRLVLFEKGHWNEEKVFPSQEYQDLSEILHSFLPPRRKIQKAVLGVAGPIHKGRCEATNLPWVIDAQHIQKAFSIGSVHLLNDLEAHAYGIGALSEKEIYVLHPGEKNAGNAALISAGTGLGEAGLFWDGKRHHPFACEGGHTDFAPREERDLSLWRYLQEKYSHVSYERVVSGPGILDLFSFLIEKEKKVSKVRVSDPEEGAKEISEAALAQICPVCREAVEWFVRCYGAEAGNLALKYLAVGGLYVGGGIAPKLLPFFTKDLFLTAFWSKGRFDKLLEKIPVKIILNDKTALLGALEYALRE